METKDNNTTVGNQDTQNPSTQEGNPKMVIEITRYKGIVDAFNNPRSLAKLIVVIALIIVIVFGGITGIALVIKNYYPYKTVNSNEYGATIIQNEDNEVIYWLFNSAELWANSGIYVKKGDVISVRASGAFHTAIHHLVEDADSNKMRHKWLNPIGGPNSSEAKDNNRAAFRISTTASFNKMLMQVIPDSVVLKNDTGAWNPCYAPYIDGRAVVSRDANGNIIEKESIFPDIYAIGSERDKITIRTDGVLYFTVNDIALTKEIICQMMDHVRISKKKDDWIDTGDLHLGKFPKPDNKDIKRYKEILENGLDALKKNNSGYTCDRNKLYAYDRLVSIFKNTGQKEINANYINLYINRRFTELDYYLITNFVDAWFVDNAGSFLIVIERKKQ